MSGFMKGYINEDVNNGPTPVGDGVEKCFVEQLDGVNYVQIV
jgi:hypothetical protein